MKKVERKRKENNYNYVFVMKTRSVQRFLLIFHPTHCIRNCVKVVLNCSSTSCIYPHFPPLRLHRTLSNDEIEIKVSIKAIRKFDRFASIETFYGKEAKRSILAEAQMLASGSIISYIVVNIQFYNQDEVWNKTNWWIRYFRLHR